MIRSPDADVTVLACCYIATLCKFKQGCCFVLAPKFPGALSTSIPLHKVRYGHAVCCAHSRLHAFSGCDSTSSFVGCGKKTGLPLILWASDCAARQAMTLLGIFFDMHVHVTCWTCKQFVCQLYTCTYGLKKHMACPSMS